MAKAGVFEQPWIRVLFFAICLAVLGFGLSLAIPYIPLPETEPGNESKSSLSTVIRALVSVVACMITVFIFRKKIDKRSLTSLGLNFKGNGNFAATGICAAIVILGISVIALFLGGNLEFTDIRAEGSSIYIGLGLMAMIAIAEELAFRGYVLSTILPVTNRWVALLVSAIFFALLHAGNPGAGLVPVINVFFAGLLLGVNYIYTRNLWFGILLHFGWNFFQGPVLGFPVSGVDLDSVLELKMQGSPIITGSGFGLEGSVIAGALLLLMTAALAFIYRKKFEPAGA